LYAPVLEKYIKKEVFHKTPKKKLLINQPGRHGDIIICLPIARHYSVSFDVFWLCPDEYHPMFSYVDYCTPVSKDSGGYDFIIDLSFGFGGPPEKWWQETIHTWDSFVTAKYYLADVPLEEKWNLHWNRDKQKEDSLYNLVVGEEKYIVVHDSGSSGSFPISIDSKLDVIVFSPIENYTVFDWYKVLMNAEEIHCVDSLLLNFVDSCIYGPKKIFHDVRNSDKVLNALMKKDEWEVMS
jgi:hypothetical protein